jgi:hypothetical protein
MAAQGSFSNALNMAQLIDQLRQGRAIFFINHGSHPARRATSTAEPILLRSKPITDVQSMVDYLRGTFLVACKASRLPINNLYDYFDHFDVHQVDGRARMIKSPSCSIAIERPLCMNSHNHCRKA